MKSMAGREMDAIVAEKVMGLNLGCWHLSVTLVRVGSNLMRCDSCGEEYGQTTLAMDQSRQPNYSTDIREAWKVVDRMRALGWTFEFNNQDIPCAAFWQKYRRSDREIAVGATAAIAICKAAIRAIAATDEQL